MPAGFQGLHFRVGLYGIPLDVGSYRGQLLTARMPLSKHGRRAVRDEAELMVTELKRWVEWPGQARVWAGLSRMQIQAPRSGSKELKLAQSGKPVVAPE